MRRWALTLGLLAVSQFAAAYEDLGPETWNPRPWLENKAALHSEQDCVALERFGCWYAPPTIRNANAPTLLVFFRGWRSPQERSNVPPGQRMKSARQAFIQFGLDQLAREKSMAVLITGASPLPIGADQVDGIERTLGLRFSRIVLSSHSAGFQGLDATLSAGTFPHIDRIVMLDNFYMEGTLLDSVTELAGSGTTCNGFFTYDSRLSIQAHQAAFKRICRLEDHDDTGHFNTINKCLGRYVDGLDCP